MITRRIGFVFLGLTAALAVASGLWLGVFRQEAAASPGIDLVITKTASPAEPTLVVQGGTITYTLTVTNVGDTPATDVVIRDIPEAGLTFVSIAGASESPAPTAPAGVTHAPNIAASGGTGTVTVVFDGGRCGWSRPDRGLRRPSQYRTRRGQ